MDEASNEVRYGTVEKLVTVNFDPDPLHIALFYPFTVTSCTALQDLHRTSFTEELTRYYPLITRDFVSIQSRSVSLVVINTDTIIMQLFDVILSLCPLVNENVN